MRVARRRLIAALSAAIAITPGQASAQSLASNIREGCARAPFEASADYFPDKLHLEDATNFRVEYRRSFKVVTVRDANPGGVPAVYVLVQCGTPPPRLLGALSGAQIINVPVASIFVASATHLPLLVDLGRVDVLTGVSRLRELSGAALAARVATGRVHEFAPMSVVDSELIIAHRPSLFMAGGATSSQTWPVIRAAGIPVVLNTEWLEPTALARAEWLKYMAVFLNEERKATELFNSMKARYRLLNVRALAQPESKRPRVMTGRSTRGTFTIAGGRSYVAALIHDAGGRYVWDDNTSVGAPSVDLEAQIRRAANADVWINGGGWPNAAAMLENEPRYTAFKAYRDRQVWVYDLPLTTEGTNDYFLRSVSRPDLVLADLIKIFHPALVPDHAFEWYTRVPERAR